MMIFEEFHKQLASKMKFQVTTSRRPLDQYQRIDHVFHCAITLDLFNGVRRLLCMLR